MIQFGSYVKSSRHGHIGRVTGVSFKDPVRDKQWMDIQSIPLTESQRRGIWVDFLVHEGGAVSVPIDAVAVIDKFDFKNRSSKKYFGKLEDV